MVTPPLGGGGDRYYDDNAWIGLALVRHHELTEEPKLLLLARRVFSFVVSGWTDEETWASPGGIRWKEPKSNRSRNTCVNGSASELAARLFEKTGESTYLEWATRIYHWTREALSDSEGLYDDQVAPNGSRTRTIWSYNQGSMIGAGVLLHKHTGEPTYLGHARGTAATYIEQRGTPELMTQDPAFNAVFFRNLFLLDPEQSDDRFHSMAADYGSFMWDHMRLRNGLFVGNGSALNNAAAMMQLYALLAGAEPHA
jgi:predicted alpha-1,6-mannanase (GH76 family)